jgi:DNA-binding transcriptional LysR family regulator
MIQMDYRYLKAFLVTAKCKNFTRAAEELGVAQSAVSRQISLLEEDLKRQLFFRTSRKVMLTPDGEELFQNVSNLESWLQSNFHRKKQTIRIGAQQGILENWLVGKLSEMKKNGAGSPNLIISVGNPDWILHGLENGSLDLGFTTKRSENGMTSSRKIFDESFCLISKKPVSLKAIHEEVWIYGVRGENLNRLSKKRSERFIQVDSMTALLKLVSAGVGVAVVPKHLVSDAASFHVQDLPMLRPGGVYICIPNFKKVPMHLKEFLKSIEDSN